MLPVAKAGLDVLVVEKNDYIGGAVTREMHEGWFTQAALTSAV